jgi:Xaa-Pro aminopeptidase
MDLTALPSRSPARKLALCRQRLEAWGLDAYWFVRSADVRYLSGFTGEDSTLLVTRRRTFLITDSRFSEQAETEGSVSDIVVRTKPMAVETALICKQMGVRKLGLTSSCVTHADFLTLTSEMPAERVAACKHNPVAEARTRKSADEVKQIVCALRIAEAAFRRFATQVEPGRSERWLAGLLEWEMRAGGAEGVAFPTICAAGSHGSMPHAVSSSAKLGPGEPLLVDWGARAGGYCSDLTRLLCTGTMLPRLRELAQVVLEAQEAAFRKIAPGVRCEDVDRAARSVIARAGYGSYFGHSLGHGVGLEVHEAPRLGPDSKEMLLPGTVFTVEPGIYLPGQAGVRIEDMVLITGKGFEVLSSLARVLPGC